MVRYIALLVGLATAACASHEYVYEPASQVTGQVAGRAAANYQIPPELPQGDARVATFGIAKIRPRGAPDNAYIRALHVRLVVANNSDQPWTLDTREQRVVLPGNGQSRPAFASVQGASPPMITIEPGNARSINLFFPLPPTMQKPERIPQFDVVWQVQTSTRVVTERTPFERVEIVPEYTYASPYVGFGPSWYDPYYPYGAFYGVGALPPAYIERPVIIQPPPASRIR